MESLYKIIEGPLADTGNGSLMMFQAAGKNAVVPFAIKKVLLVQGMKPADVRGKHAHRKTTEMVMAVQGGCDVEVDDGTRKETVRIEGWQRSILLPARVWRTLTNFAENTILLIIADTEYDEADYLRDYEAFLKMVRA